MAERGIGEALRRTPRDAVDVALKWARASLTAVPGMASHRARWVVTRHLEDFEADPLPAADRAVIGDPATIQPAAAGRGPLHRRRYRVCIRTGAAPADVVRGLATDLDDGTPDLFVRFLGADGRPARRLDLGDEVLARLTAPVDGPVRVVELRDDGVRLLTLQGHAEAGEIDFLVEQDGPGRLRFTIRSWARSSTPVVRALYERGGGREVQTHVWTSLCLAVARRHGTAIGRVEVADRTDPWGG